VGEITNYCSVSPTRAVSRATVKHSSVSDSPMRHIATLLVCVFLLAVPTATAQNQISWTTSPVVLDTGLTSWCTFVQLSDGSWLAAYAVFPSPTFIRVKRSFDAMRTWQQVSEIHEDGRDLDNPRLFLRSDGVPLIALRSVITGQSYEIEVYQTADNGNSFQLLSQVDWDEHLGGLYEPSLATLPDGSLAAFYTNEKHQHDHPSYSQIISERVSPDNGLTWGPEIFVIAQPGTARSGEPNAVTFQDCPQMALFYEMCATENCLGHVSYSTDGRSWSPIGPPLPSTFQDIQAVETTSGLIFGTSNSYDVIVSPDDTTSWIDTNSHPFTFGQWPAIAQTGPNEIAVGLTGAGVQGQSGEFIQFGDISQLGLKHLSTSRACSRVAPDPRPCRPGKPCAQ
jgi:hypothetical protein